MENPKNILVVAGEASGDIHAASLIRQIKNTLPNINFFGLGGFRLKAEGVEIYYDMVSLAVVGFFEVFKHLWLLKKIFHDIVAELDEKKPIAAILVDYPGFNLQLAAQLHKRGIPVIYYVSPQIWAWGKKRIKTIKDSVSLMMVFFAFEKDLYEAAGVNTCFVGHPLLDIVKPTLTKQEFFKKNGLQENKITISLLPGSREKEIKTLLPVMLKTSQLLLSHFKERLQFVLLAAPTVKKELFAPAVSLAEKLPLLVISDDNYSALAASDFALVCSGTATLETGLLCIPMAVLYKVNILTWLFIKSMIRIPYIGLVNVVMGRKIIEEFIQFDAQPHRIARHMITLLEDNAAITQLRQELSTIRAQLGEKGATNRASEAAVEFINKL
jgi:lipid-A-disaccharide synthase